jgi:acetyltransferase-like isoleucine patch superfamily enzyme
MDGTKPMRFQLQDIRPIEIGKNVWIGANSVILKGIEIGDGGVVGAGSVVTKSIPANEIWAGNPARKIRERNLYRQGEVSEKPRQN